MRPENLELITELRHALHAHPELSGQEVETRRRLQDFIKQHTDFQVHDEGSWFWVEVPPRGRAAIPESAASPSHQTDAPAIAFRADMDALPILETLDLPHCSQNRGVSHKCGHDGHSAALAGLALELQARPPEREVILIFQHAEEIGAGGFPASRLLERKPIAAVYAFHNWSGIPRGCVATRVGVSQCASLGLTVRMRGVTAHASQPEDGRNPAIALSKLALFSEELAGVQHLGHTNPHFKDLALSTIVNLEVGAKDFGISASAGEVSLTLRAREEADLEKLKDLILETAEQLANEGGFQLTSALHDVFPETRNSPESVAVVERGAGRAGLPLVQLEVPYRASEDFGHYLKLTKGAMVYIGNGEDYPPIHTDKFDFVDSNLEVAVNLWLAILAESN